MPFVRGGFSCAEDHFIQINLHYGKYGCSSNTTQHQATKDEYVRFSNYGAKCTTSRSSLMPRIAFGCTFFLNFQ